MSPIIWRPQFIVRISLSWSISTLALRFMQIREIYSYNYSFWCSRYFWGNIVIVIVILDDWWGFEHGPVNDELLRDREWLDDNVSDINRCLRYLQFMPSLAFIEGVEYISSRSIMLGHNYQTTVIPKLINVSTFAHLIPVKAAIPREVCWHPILDIPAAQVGSNISHSHNHADGTILRIRGCVEPVSRVYL